MIRNVSTKLTSVQPLYRNRLDNINLIFLIWYLAKTLLLDFVTIESYYGMFTKQPKM